jgi:RNA polymerase sigma-70 factor (ECF subfamily)
MSVIDVREAITRAHHEEWARVLAALTRRFGDLDIAEEAAAEAFATAVERWPSDGVPPNPGAWLTTTANRKAIDRIRRENKRGDKQREAQTLYDATRQASRRHRRRSASADLHLLSPASRWRPAWRARCMVAVSLRRDRRAFLVQETTMEQSPARGQDQGGSHPYRDAVREGSLTRVSGVLTVLYLVFNEGALRPAPTAVPVRHDLTARRSGSLADPCLTARDGGGGLLALCSSPGPPAARVSEGGWSPSTSRTVGLGRGAWSPGSSAGARRWPPVGPGRYQILAAISAGTPLPEGTSHRLVRVVPSMTSSPTSTPRRSTRPQPGARGAGLTAEVALAASTVLRTHWPRYPPTSGPRRRAGGRSQNSPRRTTKPSSWRAPRETAYRRAAASGWVSARVRGLHSSALSSAALRRDACGLRLRAGLWSRAVLASRAPRASRRVSPAGQSGRHPTVDTRRPPP